MLSSGWNSGVLTCQMSFLMEDRDTSCDKNFYVKSWGVDRSTNYIPTLITSYLFPYQTSTEISTNTICLHLLSCIDKCIDCHYYSSQFPLQLKRTVTCLICPDRISIRPCPFPADNGSDDVRYSPFPRQGFKDGRWPHSSLLHVMRNMCHSEVEFVNMRNYPFL